MTAQPPAHSNDEHQQLPGNYPPFLAENETEIARLLLQHRYLSKFMGGILPNSVELTGVQHVLDVACGVGGWVLDMARQHPTMQVVGIDMSEYYIEQAGRMAQSEQITNATLVVQDMRHLEDVFSLEYFDFINIRFIAGELTLHEYPTLLQTLVRLCKPGGIIYWLEGELPVTNSLACQQFEALVLRALKAAERAFSPNNHALGITPFMGHWLRSAGCRIKQDNAYAIEVSAGTTAHSTFVRQAWVFGSQVQPFLLATGVTTTAEFEDLFQRMQREIQADTFCGICFLRGVTGVRRRADDPPEPFRY